MMRTFRATLAVAVTAAAGVVGVTPAAQAQKNDAALIVDGVVREVFASPRQGQVDYLVQIEAARSELGRTPREAVRVIVPAPGEPVYVHLSDKGAGNQPRFLGGSPAPAQAGAGARLVPAERAQIRAYLSPRPGGGWVAVGADWYELTAREQMARGANDPPPALDAAGAAAPAPAPAPAPTGAPAAGGASVLADLGLEAESRTVSGRFVLRVTAVKPSSAAARAGLEAGDVIVGANGQPLADLDGLAQLVRQGKNLALLVLDVNSGRTAQVNVDLASVGQAPVTTGRPTAPAGERRSLGLSAEPVRVGQRNALKVVATSPGSPCEKAGLEPGDIIVGANGVPITDPESFVNVVRQSGPTLTLIVRDTRSGQDVQVPVELGGGPAIPPAASNTPAQAPQQGAGRRLGAVTEVVFLDAEVAVKVTEVEAGSPAQKAGLEVGDIILEANGTPVLHPDDLARIVSKSGANLTIVVVDPRQGRKAQVQVNLDGR